MNRLNSLTSDVLGSASNIFSQGMQKAQEWTGHIVNYVKQTPEMLAQNPTAAIALIFSANTLFLFVMNWPVNRLDSYLAGEDKERSYKQIFICEPLFAASVFAFNSLLSNITKAQLSYAVITAITATSLALRILINHVLFKEEPEVPEEGIEPQSPIPQMKETPKVEEVLGADTPEKPPVPLPSPKRDVEIANLRLEIAKETARANKILSQQSDAAVKIAELDSEIAQLKEAQNTLEKEKTKALSEGSDAKQEAARLEKERSALESEKGSLLKQVENLQSSLDQTESAKTEAQKALETLEAETAALNERAAKAEHEVLKVKNDAKDEKKSLDARIATLMQEKAQDLSSNNKIVEGLKKSLKDLEEEIEVLQSQKDQSDQDKLTAQKEREEALEAVEAAEERAETEHKIKLRMEKEKNKAYDEVESLTQRVEQLEKDLMPKIVAELKTPVKAANANADKAVDANDDVAVKADDANAKVAVKSMIRVKSAGELQSPSKKPPAGEVKPRVRQANAKLAGGNKDKAPKVKIDNGSE